MTSAEVTSPLVPLSFSLFGEVPTQLLVFKNPDPTLKLQLQSSRIPSRIPDSNPLMKGGGLYPSSGGDDGAFPPTRFTTKRRIPLSEKNGKAILTYIYDKRKKLEQSRSSIPLHQSLHSSFTPTYVDPRQKGIKSHTRNWNVQLHSDSVYYLSKEEQSYNHQHYGTVYDTSSQFTPIPLNPQLKEPKKSTRGLLDDIGDSLGIVTDENIKLIDLPFLIANDITLKVLIRDCKIKIVDLYGADIITNWHDLTQLGFSTSDLVIDRQLFNVNDICQFYGMTYSSLRDRIGFSILDMMDCRFAPSELYTLGFSLATLIENKGMDREHLSILGYPLQHCKDLGFGKLHANLLSIDDLSIHKFIFEIRPCRVSK